MNEDDHTLKRKLSTMQSTPLTPSITSLRTSLTHLSSSLNILQSGINDFPRLQTVLSSTRHFELIPQHTLSKAQQSLHDELGPAVEELLTRAEAVIGRLERRENALEARRVLQEGRLYGGESTARSSRKSSVALGGGDEKALRYALSFREMNWCRYSVLGWRIGAEGMC
jgi:DASH complex subunit SPC19